MDCGSEAMEHRAINVKVHGQLQDCFKNYSKNCSQNRTVLVEEEEEIHSYDDDSLTMAYGMLVIPCIMDVQHGAVRKSRHTV